MKKILLSLVLVAVAIGGYTAYKKRYWLALWWTLQMPEPQWAKEQIENDFAPFTVISQETLQATFEKARSLDTHIFRYRIVKGEIFRTPAEDPIGRAPIFDRMLQRLNKAKQLPPLDFIVCMSDGVPEGTPDFWIVEKQAPLLSWAKRKELASYVVLIPDFLTTRESCWNIEIDTINDKFRTLPWEARKEKAFWRGTSNDKGYTLTNYTKKPRYLISLLAKEHPEAIDAGFCRAFPPDIEALFHKMGLLVGNAPIADHLEYKYLPVLDGYMCTFPGFQWRLLSGSLTMKQESDEIQYFYGALKPYEHYVPIKNDMSDLREKIAWAIDHDADCKRIAENARLFALQNLMPEQIYAYLYRLLKKYAALQDFEPQAPSPSKWKKV